jgi:hypothetical protein
MKGTGSSWRSTRNRKGALSGASIEADNGIATLEDRARGLHADLKETDWNL